jgi:Reverse transcriptase (RNA-dependent DNA polymerase)
MLSYRPISNLSVVSKLKERFVAGRLLSYLTSMGLMPSLQSAYCAYHSTKTAVLRVLTDILQVQALDRGDFTALTLLDLSAAFDNVDHTALLHRLEVTYGVCCSALSRFASYLSDRTQYVRSGSTTSQPTRVRYGVPLGSVFGPILFL